MKTQPHSTRLTTTLAILFFIGLSALPAHAVIFEDNDFVPAQWQTQLFMTQTSTANNTTQPNGGNPANFRSLYMYSSMGFMQPTGRSMVVELKTSAVVSPAALGGITQVDYAEDHYCECFGGSVLWGPALEQNGTYYIVAGNTMPNGINVVWGNEILTGLTETDFVEVDVNAATWSNPASHPDFSAAGSSVTFGFVRAKAFTGWTESTMDNWTLHVNETVVSTGQKSWGSLKTSYR